MIKYVPVILLLVLSIACTNNSKKVNKNSVEIIGHGGSGLNLLNTMPMNSKKSISQALSVGASGIEVDLQITNDGVAVLYHDDVLENQTNCNGSIANKSVKELVNCTYNSFFQQLMGNNEPILLLDSLLIFLNTQNPKPRLVLDLKFYKPDNSNQQNYQYFSAAIMQHLNKKYPIDLIYIESTSVTLLKELKEINPELNLFIYVTNFEKGLNSAKNLNLTGITIKENLINLEQVEEAQNAGMLVSVWGVKNKNQNLSAMQKGVNFIQTDDVKSALSLLK